MVIKLEKDEAANQINDQLFRKTASSLLALTQWRTLGIFEIFTRILYFSKQIQQHNAISLKR